VGKRVPHASINIFTFPRARTERLETSPQPMLSCKHFEACSSNLCPRDADIHLRTWFLDEDICPLQEYRHLPFIRRQRQLKKRQPPSFKPSANKTTCLKTNLHRTAHHSPNTMTHPDDFCHHLPRNRHANAFDSIHGRCYPKNVKQRFLITCCSRRRTAAKRKNSSRHRRCHTPWRWCDTKDVLRPITGMISAGTSRRRYVRQRLGFNWSRGDGDGSRAPKRPFTTGFIDPCASTENRP